MKRFIIGRLGVFTLLAAFCAVGCAFEQTSEQSGEGTETSEEGVVGVGNNDEEQSSAGDQRKVKHSASSTSSKSTSPEVANGCSTCGPLPDPWKNGPLPDPWTNPGSSSSGGSSTSSSSSSSSSSSGSNPKP